MEKLRFSAADREQIRKQAVGEPTGVIFAFAGFKFDLVPLTVEQGKQICAIVDAIAPFMRADGVAEMQQDVLAQVIGRDGPRATSLLHDILHESALANDLINESDAGEEAFDEWFGKLSLFNAVKQLWPKLIEAQGMSTMLGNSSTPAPEPMTTTGS